MTENLLLSAITVADVAIVVCDAAGNIVVSNSAARELFGGNTLPDTHPLFRSLDTGVEVAAEFPIVDKGGALTSVLVSARVVFDENGNKAGAVATARRSRVPFDRTTAKPLRRRNASNCCLNPPVKACSASTSMAFALSSTARLQPCWAIVAKTCLANGCIR